MQTRFHTIAFDADDTLWHNEAVFRLTQERFSYLIRDVTDTTDLNERLLEAERRNLGHYGYGVKGFVLSMIETAIEVTDGTVPNAVISELMAAGREMLSHPIDLLDGVEDTLRTLAPHHRLVIITKGDLLDQERKVAQSGLGPLFEAVHVVAEKTTQIYRRWLPDPAGTLMVGNSMKSDILPALAAGAWGLHIPHDITWELEQADGPQDTQNFGQITSIRALPEWLAKQG